MNEFTVRHFEFQRDYPDVCEWWRARDWNYLPKDLLPYNGFVSEKDGVKFAASFIYLMEAQWSVLEWVVTNPGSPIRERREGIKQVVMAAVELAKKNSVKRVFSSLKNRNLIKIFEECGFRATDFEMTNLLWRSDL